jgi:hypothetical protein
LPLENLEFHWEILSRTNSIVQENNVLQIPASSTDGFLLKDLVVLLLRWIAPC